MAQARIISGLAHYVGKLARRLPIKEIEDSNSMFGFIAQRALDGIPALIRSRLDDLAVLRIRVWIIPHD